MACSTIAATLQQHCSNEKNDNSWALWQGIYEALVEIGPVWVRSKGAYADAWACAARLSSWITPQKNSIFTMFLGKKSLFQGLARWR